MQMQAKCLQGIEKMYISSYKFVFKIQKFKLFCFGESLKMCHKNLFYEQNKKKPTKIPFV